MASCLSKLVFLVLIFCYVSGGRSDIGESACLKVPASEFAGAVKSTVKEVQKVISIVSPFAGKIGDFRLSNAVADCLDLMDLTMDHLSSAVSASQNPNENNSTGNVRGDIKAMLSGALINQDTCLEGFDGTNAILKTLVAGTLNRVTELTRHLLSMVNQPDRVARKLTEFPHWLNPHDRKLLQAATATASDADAAVAADGTGNYTTIAEAIRAAPENSAKKRFVIYVKKGVYKEYIDIGKKKRNIMMIGDGIEATVISGNRNFVDGWTTYRSATFAVKGLGFIARDITFENTAGPAKHQAVAYRSDSDLSVLYRCSVKGYQDSLYAHSMRQFYRECQITGTVDFIFGDATAHFQTCQIQARKPLPNQKNTITAQGRKAPTEETGFSLQFCNISADPEVVSTNPTYLGRPWKEYSRTVIMQSYLGSAIRPEGFLEWDGDFALDTLYYGEYMNYGPGSGLGARVKWPGYHVINDSSQANEFTVAEFIDGDMWLPSTGVRYIAGLTM